MEIMAIFVKAIDTVFDAIILTVYSLLRTEKKEQTSRMALLPPRTEVSETTVEDVVEEPTDQQTFRPIAHILNDVPLPLPEIGRNMIMYAGAYVVPVYKEPTIEFDTQIATIRYGEMVTMLEPKGRFYRVAWGTTLGWVLRENLADRAVRVFPEFIVGEEYSVDHPATAQVRSVINDPFGLSYSEFGLQAGEYVVYRLWRKGIHIDWPDVRPRTPGLWHVILKGTPRVHIGVLPKVGSIMEYLFKNEVGHLAYVEAVFPDNTISISEINYPDSGIYNERELSKEEWKELKPVFISVT